MKYKDIKGMSIDELMKKRKAMREDLFELRMKSALGQVGNPLQIRLTRRDIARLETALGQRAIGQEKHIAK